MDISRIGYKNCGSGISIKIQENPYLRTLLSFQVFRGFGKTRTWKFPRFEEIFGKAESWIFLNFLDLKEISKFRKINLDFLNLKEISRFWGNKS